MRKTNKISRTDQPVAPLGLRAVFNALQPFGFQCVHGWTQPPAAFAELYQAIERTDQDRASDAFSVALSEYINREYTGATWGRDGNEPASECAEVAAMAAFWAGVATCWYVMTSIHGGGER